MIRVFRVLRMFAPSITAIVVAVVAAIVFGILWLTFCLFAVGIVRNRLRDEPLAHLADP